MKSLWMLGSLVLGDFLLLVGGFPSSLLLLVCPYLFVRNRSLWAVLYGGGAAAFFEEILHARLPGTLMLGVGVAVLLLHLGMDVLNWKHPGTRMVGLLVFLISVEFTRVLTIRVLEGPWIFPDFTFHLATLLLGWSFIVYRTVRRSRPGTG